jgi:hypothetical protein
VAGWSDTNSDSDTDGNTDSDADTDPDSDPGTGSYGQWICHKGAEWQRTRRCDRYAVPFAVRAHGHYEHGG